MSSDVESIVNGIGNDLSRRAALLRIKKALTNQASPAEWTVNDMLLGLLKKRTDDSDDSGPGLVLIRNKEGLIDWWVAGDMPVDEFLGILENIKLQVIFQKVEQFIEDDN